VGWLVPVVPVGLVKGSDDGEGLGMNGDRFSGVKVKGVLRLNETHRSISDVGI
jgi:hypothetical protein